MTIASSALSTFSGLTKYQDTQLLKTGDNNITASTATVYEVIIDNTLNAAEAEYVKFYNSAAPTYNVTAPDDEFLIPAGISRTIFFPEGKVYGTGLSMCACKEPGTTVTNSPTASLSITIYATT